MLNAMHIQDGKPVFIAPERAVELINEDGAKEVYLSFDGDLDFGQAMSDSTGDVFKESIGPSPRVAVEAKTAMERRSKRKIRLTLVVKVEDEIFSDRVDVNVREEMGIRFYNVASVCHSQTEFINTKIVPACRVADAAARAANTNATIH